MIVLVVAENLGKLFGFAFDLAGISLLYGGLQGVDPFDVVKEIRRPRVFFDKGSGVIELLVRSRYRRETLVGASWSMTGAASSASCRSTSVGKFQRLENA